MYDVLHKFTGDYRVIVVGDAAMSPYEITSAGGSVEHWNEEPGAIWMERLQRHFPRLVWLNPEREDHWKHSQSCQITQQLIGADRMFPLSLAGLESAMKRLAH